jgi:hypothetical protein
MSSKTLSPPPSVASGGFDTWMKLQLYERLKNLGESSDSSGLTAAQVALLTGGNDTILHFHSDDRKRSNHTGTQPASTISDLDAVILRSVATIGSNHATLANLAWSVSGHTGTASNLAGFSGTGAAAYYSLGTGVATFLATPSSANLAAAVTDETGSGGALVFASGPTLTGTTTVASLAVTTGATLNNAVALNAKNFTGTARSLLQLFSDNNVYLDSFDGSFMLRTGATPTTALTVTTAQAATFAGTLGVTGDFAVNTNKFTVAASSGNTLVAGTLNVTGVATLGALGVTDLTTTGNTILGDASTDTLNVGNGDLRKDASGNTGLSVAPVPNNANSRVLHIHGGANGAELRLTNTATGSAAVNGSVLEVLGSDVYLYNFEAAKLFLGTNTTEAVQIDSSQNVGVGMTPGRKFDVTGTFGATGAATLGSTLDVTGAVTGSSFADSKGDVRTIVQNSKSTAYTTVLSDAGKHIFHPSADTTARTWTIDSNANVAYPVGTAITFVNQHSAGVITLSITTDTMRLAGTGSTGSRTLAADGIATALKVATTEWLISGTGLS